MLVLLFYYLVLPFLAAWLVLLFIRKYGRQDLPEDMRLLYQRQPLEKGGFRVLRRDHKGLRVLGDFETHGEAVERAYKGREEAQAAAERAAFMVANDRGETLDEVDS